MYLNTIRLLFVSCLLPSGTNSCQCSLHFITYLTAWIARQLPPIHTRKLSVHNSHLIVNAIGFPNTDHCSESISSKLYVELHATLSVLCFASTDVSTILAFPDDQPLTSGCLQGNFSPTKGSRQVQLKESLFGYVL